MMQGHPRDFARGSDLALPVIHVVICNDAAHHHIQALALFRQNTQRPVPQLRIVVHCTRAAINSIAHFDINGSYWRWHSCLHRRLEVDGTTPVRRTEHPSQSGMSARCILSSVYMVEHEWLPIWVLGQQVFYAKLIALVCCAHRR